MRDITIPLDAPQIKHIEISPFKGVFLTSGTLNQLNRWNVIKFDKKYINSLNITDKADLLKSLNQTLPSCKDISFSLFGISLAGLNFLSSLLILIYSVRTLVYEKN